MSIFAYVGLPGSGKTHTVVEHQLLPAIKAGRRVVTNIPLHRDKIARDFPGAELVELPLEAVSAAPESIYDYVTPGTVLIMDEVWRIFPAGTKANHVPEPFRKLLAEHRHMVNAKGESCQIVLVTQDLAQISAFARQLVEQTFRTVKLSSVGLSKQYRLDIYQGSVSGPNPPQQQKLRDLFGRYHKGVWQYYKSHTMSEREEGGADERPMDRRGNILKAPAFIVGVVLVVAGAFWVVPKLGNTFSRDAGLLGTAKVSERVGGPAGAAAAPTTSGSTPTAPALFTGNKPHAATGSAAQYRLAAVVINHEDKARSRAIVTDGQRLFVIPYDKHCYATPDGRNFCQFKGVEVGEYLIASPNRGA